MMCSNILKINELLNKVNKKNKKKFKKNEF